MLDPWLSNTGIRGEANTTPTYRAQAGVKPAAARAGLLLFFALGGGDSCLSPAQQWRHRHTMDHDAGDD